MNDYNLNQPVNVITESSLERNLHKYIDFLSFVRWYPDLYLDLIKPKDGGIHLHFDQRVFLRAMSRFYALYGCFPRGFSKTYLEILEYFITAVAYPNISLSVTAQTKESAADFLKDKCAEILRHYPMFENEIKGKPRFQRGEAEIIFKNGSKIDNLANSQNSKGQRRNRLHIEESAMLNNEVFEDALKPVVEVPRYTAGKLAIANPEELNRQIHFFTTPGFRGSSEFERNLHMIKNMIDLKGDFVIGANWMLPCWYGRGSLKNEILERKKVESPIAFAQNYGGEWTGCSDNALVNIDRLLSCRVLKNPILKAEKNTDEYYMGVDVARSQNTNNNQSSAIIGKVNRNPATGRIISIEIANIHSISNVLSFDEQAIKIKKIANEYKPKVVVVDGNGLGAGLIDALLKEHIDPITKESLGCWDTINTDNKPESEYAEKCVFDLKASGIQTKIITAFVDCVDSGKLKLLEKRQENDFTDKDRENFEENILPFIQTDLLIEEISNLKVKYGNNNNLSIEKVIKKIDKDRFSALAYMIFYIYEFCSFTKREVSKQFDISKFPFRAATSCRERW